MLTNQSVQIEDLGLGSISPEAVRQTLNKRLQTRRRQQWLIPPRQSEKFVPRMEYILDVYHYIGAKNPIVTMISAGWPEAVH